MLRKICISLVIYLFALGAQANVYTLNPVKITKNVFCVFGDINGPDKNNLGFASNVCYVDIGNGVVVLDAGPTWQFGKELDALIQKELHKPVKYVVLTNYHDDRILGASYFAEEKDIKIIGHRAIVSDIDKNPQKYERIIKVVPADVYRKTKVVKPNLLVDGNYTIKGKNLEVALIKPSKVSQSPSDILVYIAKEKFLFAGNIIFNDRMINYAHDSNMDGWLKALEMIESLHPEYIVGGHGKLYDKTAPNVTKAYLQSIKKQIEKYYDEDVGLENIVQRVKVDEFKNLAHFDALNGKNIYNYYIQLEWSE